MRDQMKKTDGFTLFELVIVISIMAIILGFSIPAYQSYTEKTTAIGARKDAKSVLQIANVYATSVSSTSIFDENYLDEKIERAIQDKYTKGSASNYYKYVEKGPVGNKKLFIQMKLNRGDLNFESELDVLGNKSTTTCVPSNPKDQNRCDSLNNKVLSE
ncbi:MAG: prepilin-type N-terminal cleavage/methylation domain-containing protein [Erysipelotrichaceae bacterium]